MEPWKRWAIEGWEQLRKRGFNGATAMEPWKSIRKVSQRTDVGIGFNGATAMEPWKRPGVP